MTGDTPQALERVRNELMVATTLVLRSDTLAHGMVAALPPTLGGRVQQQIDHLDEALSTLRWAIVALEAIDHEG